MIGYERFNAKFGSKMHANKLDSAEDSLASPRVEDSLASPRVE